MRPSPLALAVLLAVAGGAAARSELPSAPAPTFKAAARAMYVVEFAEPPLASYRGQGSSLSPKLAGLKATSPAVTGARKLDVNAPASKAYRDALADLRAERLAASAAKLGRPLPPVFVYDVVTNGVSLELTAAEADVLRAVPGVARVEREREKRLMSDAGPRWIGADQIWNGLVSAPSRGEGTVLGLIDSGINRTHPSFAGTGPVDGHVHLNPKGRFYGRCAEAATASECNAKLIGIYDFTTSSSSQETNDGADVTGHGTHVGSTAIGNVLNASFFQTGPGSEPRPISGVAPHAAVISYKACEGRPNGESTCFGTLAAINQAVADGVDVINYSLGGTGTDPWASSDATALLSAREAGIVVVVAAGNEGAKSGSITSPGDAPWVLGVAATTHDRAIRNVLLDLAGGASAPPNGGVLPGVGLTGGVGPRPLVIDPLFPGCAQGDDLDAEQTGASNPWPPGRFNGEIVVCERGTQARVAKSNNVRLAGGGGMILVNREVEGETVVADPHSIPTVHLGFSAGRALKQWMATGTGHSGRIAGNSVVHLPELGDVLADFSGRGPAVTLGIVKPDVAAPGVSVFAAVVDTNPATQFGFKSGTSMATPHVSGAALLLTAVKPAWTPTQIESALATTARPSVLIDFETPATTLDQGAGTIDVARAVQAPLFFPITPAEFRAARPSQGGSPRALNRPSIAHDACFSRCNAVRTVTDMADGGSWRVEVDLPSPASATVTPASFTLAPGQSQQISFEFDVSDAAFPGTWVDGRVKFVRTSGSGVNPEMALALYSDPGATIPTAEFSTSGESGFRDVLIGGLAPLPDATFDATPLVAPTLTDRNLVQDPTRDARYDSFGTGTFFTLVNVPVAGTGGTKFRLFAETSSATAWDVDLFVGQDTDGDGMPDEDEQLCESTGPRAAEECEVAIEAGLTAGNYWVLVQNWDAGASGAGDTLLANDAVRLQTALVPLDGAPGDSLVATGPGHLDALESFSLRLAWDDPTMLPGDKRIGYVRIGASPATVGQLAVVRVELTRSIPGENTAAVLAPNGLRHMRLAAGAAHERLYLDVPPNATSLTVATSGSGEVDLYLARDPAPTGPVIALAPQRGLSSGTSIHPGATESITLTGAALQAGRWYVVPVNVGTTAAEFDLSVSLQHGSARPAQKFGPYYNPARSGAGLFLYPAANGTLWSLVWYTYLQDGTPTWYLGVANAPAANDGVWRVKMSRYSWDGNANAGTEVGEAQLALTGPSAFTFSWNLDGQSGSEPMAWLDGGSCPQVNGATTSLNGMWYSPTRSGFGYALNAWPGVESNALYFYDEQGVARWALASVGPFGASSMPLTQYRSGFCPLCTFIAPTTTTIGTLTRRYDSATAGNIAVSATLQPPLNGTWNVDLPAVKLTDGLQCP